jgi:O-antigen/teichoic acid export membrane protein
MSMSSKEKSKLKSGGIWAFIGKFFTSIMTLVINAILARTLAAEDLGIYFLAFNIAMFGAYIGTVGFEQTVIRFVADSIGKRELKNVSYIIKVSLIATTTGAAVVGIIYFYSSEWIALNVFQSVRLSSISFIVIFWIAVNSFQILLGETFRGFQDIRFASIFGGVLSTAVFVLGLAVISYFNWMPITLSSTIIIWILSLTLSNIIGLVTLAKKVQILMKGAEANQKRTLHLKKVFSTGLPLLVVTVSFYIMGQCDLWIIGGVGNDQDVAIYGAAAKLTMLMSMPLVILNSVVSPIIAQKNAQGEMKGIEKTLRTIATLAFVPTLGMFLLFLLFGKFILLFVFGSSLFGGGAVILSLLAFKQLIGVWSGATGTVLAMAGKQKHLMKNTLLSGVASIILSLLLGSYFGGVGVALGFLIPSMISQVIMMVITYKSLKIRVDVDLFGTIYLLKDKFRKRNLRET